jgi:hypothetical protein
MEVRMRNVVIGLAAALVMSIPSLAAADTLKGKLSDSMCNAKHSAGEHDGKKVTDRECAEKCIREGAKYVFVGEGDKIYKISNQDFAGLKAHVGHSVILTATAKDDTLTISKIEMPPAEKK